MYTNLNDEKDSWIMESTKNYNKTQLGSFQTFIKYEQQKSNAIPNYLFQLFEEMMSSILNKMEMDRIYF